MKKILLFFIGILFAFSVSGQVTGDGRTPGTAYYGTINTPTNWTAVYNGGIIYVGQAGHDDLIVGVGGRLSIDPGVRVVFCTQTSDLIISTSGQLSAGGLGSPVTFTRYYPTYSYWGHINFAASAGVSSLNNCIIEYGDVTRNAAPANYGGGLYTDNNNVTITNCIFRYNRAEWGGGIFVNQNRNPAISNSLFLSNFSNQGGGGIYLWNYTSSVIRNCIFDSNHCNGTTADWYTGGGLGTQSYCSVKVLNCTFVNNSSNRSQGQNLMFYLSVNDVATNCIFWGPGNQFYRSGTNTITYCAMQGTLIAGTGNFVLNSVNTAVDGPNFVATDGSNWAIKYISPCRDAGTSSGTPTTDYLGNGRIGNYDIGAYEVQYSRWNGSTSTIWGTPSNWDSNIDPNSGSFDVIIPSGLTNYPTGDPSAGYVIPLNRTMILYPGAKVTLNSLRNNGSLILQSDATGISSLILNTNVTASIDLFLTGGNPGAPLLKLNKWHFISSPVNTLPISVFSPVTKNVVMWYDDQVSGSLATGWIAYNGFRYSTGTISGPTFSSLVTGIGYDYYATTDQKYTFTGTLNFSNVPVPLSYSVNDGLHGFNLLGNPFSSGLNWDDIANGVYFPYPASTSKSLYFTRDNAQCSYISGVGIPADVNGIIPPMQGFFVKTSAAGNTLTLPAAARTQGAIHPRYKGLEIIPLVRLSLSEASLSDETVVRFDAAAKTGFDDDFDAPKMFLSSDVLSLYSSLGGYNFAIDGLPFPDTFVEIPIVVNLLVAGNHTISATQLQGLDNYDVTLTDKTTGFIANLKTTTLLTFNGIAGTSADRFILRVSKLTTGIENPVISQSLFNIYPANKMLNIQTASDIWEGKSGTVNVMDLTGKTIESLNNCEFSKNSLLQIAAPIARGIYIVEIKSGLMRYVGKVVIK